MRVICKKTTVSKPNSKRTVREKLAPGSVAAMMKFRPSVLLLSSNFEFE